MEHFDLRETADKIKREISCRELGERLGLRPDRDGFVSCPFHRETAASMKLYDGERGFYCFGCHQGGDAIKLIMGVYGLDFKNAVHSILSIYGLSGVTLSEDIEVIRQREKARQEARKWLKTSLAIVQYARHAVSDYVGDLKDIVRRGFDAEGFAEACNALPEAKDAEAEIWIVETEIERRLREL